MIRLTLAALGCLAWFDGTPGTVAPETSYEQKRAAAGRDAASQIDLALWCEARGLEAQKVKHLGVAVLTDPSNALARGLLGLVEYGGKWRRPEAVADALKADVARADLLAEYAGRRLRAPLKPDAQWKLALWCGEKGLRDEARAHLATVVRLDPNHAEAWKKLGYSKTGNRWVTSEQAGREKAEKLAQQEADKKWRPRLERLREALDGKGQRKDEALRELATITDRRAVPAVWHSFVERGGNHQVEAVQLLGQIDAIEASRALATLAVGSKFDEVRRRATETLRRRDPREWADVLIAMLRDKVKYEVKAVGGPGSAGELYVEGEKQNLKRIYQAPPMLFVPFLPGDTMATDASGMPVLVHHFYQEMSGRLSPILTFNRQGTAPTDTTAARKAASMLPSGGAMDPSSLEGMAIAFDPVAQARMAQSASNIVINQTPGMTPDVIVGFRQAEQVSIPVGRMMAEAQKAAQSSVDQLQRDVAAIEAINSRIAAVDERVGSVLTSATGVSLPFEPKPWRTWFVDQLGFKYNLTTPDQAPTVVEAIPPSYQPQAVPIQVAESSITFVRHSCFGRGTPVRTLSGSRPIETIQLGDLVLTQDTATGKLGYKPVVMVHHNPPSPTFKVALGGEPIVTSPSHRFWVAGRGWVMARDLKVGDPIRTLGGVAKVGTIESGEVQPVFNLDVEGDSDFFVGSPSALVHDNTLPDLKQIPFDAPAAVAAK